MKITRLKRGYAIRLSDGEFEALFHIVMLGKADVDDTGFANLSLAARRAISGRLSDIAALRVDEDRRA